MASKRNVNNMEDSIITFFADMANNEDHDVYNHKKSTPLYCHYEENKEIVDAIIAINELKDKKNNYDYIYEKFISVEKINPHFTQRAENLVKVYKTIEVYIEYKTRWKEKHIETIKTMSNLIEEDLSGFLDLFENVKLYALACLSVENKLLEEVSKSLNHSL